MMKTVIKFLIDTDEAIAKGKNFQHFGAAAAEKITAREILVSELNLKYRPIWRQT